MFFKEDPFEERIKKTAGIGLSAFEFWSWANKNIDGIEKEKEKHNLPVACFCVDSKNSSVFSDPSKGVLVNPVNRKDFIAGVKESIQVAKQLDCSALIVTTGNTVKEISRKEQRKSIVDGLSEASKIVEDAGITLVVEPLNILVDHKEYFLSSSTEAFEIVKETNSKNIKLLLDVYHQQISEGNLISNIQSNIDLIGHFHVADVPERHEPGTGEINYVNVFKKIAELNYQGYCGLEFTPSKSSEEALRQTINLTDKSR